MAYPLETRLAPHMGYSVENLIAVGHFAQTQFGNLRWHDSDSIRGLCYRSEKGKENSGLLHWVYASPSSFSDDENI